MLIISRYNNSVYYIYICRIILGLRRPWFVLYIWVSTALISTQQPVISSFLYFLLQWKLAWRIIFKHCCFPLFIICTFCIFSTFKNNCKIMFTDLSWPFSVLMPCTVLSLVLGWLRDLPSGALWLERYTVSFSSCIFSWTKDIWGGFNTLWI